MSRIMACRRSARAAFRWALLAAAGLSGCGGGGGGESEDLHVSFSYRPSAFTLWESGTYAPSLPELEGRTPKCHLSYGQVPPGMTFQSDGCRVVGTPTEAGRWSASVVLSVDGYKGTLSSGALFEVNGPLLLPSTLPEDLRVEWGRPFSFAPALKIYNYVPRAGDQVSYTLEAPLPPGVVFDLNTGELGGTTTVQSSFDFVVSARVVRGTRVAQSPSYTGKVKVLSPDFHYDRDWSMTWAVPFRAEPKAVSPPPGAVVSYSMQAGKVLPPGLVLDAATGVVSGLPDEFSSGGPSWGASIVRTLTSPTGEASSLEFTIWPQVALPFLSYDGNTAEIRRLKSEQRFNFGTPIRTRFIDGDTLGGCAFERFGGRVEPAWLELDAATGELSATPPASAKSSFAYSFEVLCTVRRNGLSRPTLSRVTFYVD